LQVRDRLLHLLVFVSEYSRRLSQLVKLLLDVGELFSFVMSPQAHELLLSELLLPQRLLDLVDHLRTRSVGNINLLLGFHDLLAQTRHQF
jgi:hypothetical protein